MANDDAHTFIKELLTDEGLRKELDAQLNLEDFDEEDVNPEEIRDRMADVVPNFAAEHGYDFTPEEGFDALIEIQKAMSSDHELSDEELEQVAGGKSTAGKVAMSLSSDGIACDVYSVNHRKPGTKSTFIGSFFGASCN